MAYATTSGLTLIPSLIFLLFMTFVAATLILLCLWFYKQIQATNAPLVANQQHGGWSEIEDVGRSALKIFDMRHEGKISDSQSHEMFDILYQKHLKDKK